MNLGKIRRKRDAGHLPGVREDLRAGRFPLSPTVRTLDEMRSLSPLSFRYVIGTTASVGEIAET